MTKPKIPSLKEQMARSLAAMAKEPLKDPQKVLVSNLPECWKNREEDSVKDALEEFGSLSDLRVESDIDCKYAVASFSDANDASNAISVLHRKDIRRKESDKLEKSYEGLFVQHYSAAFSSMLERREKRVAENLRQQQLRIDSLENVLMAMVPPTFSKGNFGHEPSGVHFLPLELYAGELRQCLLTFDSKSDMDSKRAELQALKIECSSLVSIIPKRLVDQAKKEKEILKAKRAPPPPPTPVVGAKKAARVRDVKQVVYIDDFSMPRRNCNGEEADVELCFKSNALTHEESWEDQIRSEFATAESFHFCRNAQNERTGMGYCSFSSHSRAEKVFQTYSSPTIQLSWSESERFMRGVKGSYFFDVASLIDVEGVGKESGCQVELLMDGGARFSIKGSILDHVEVAKAALSQQLSSMHSRMSEIALYMTDVPASYDEEKLRLLFFACGGVEHLTRSGTTAVVKLKIPEKSREVASQLDGTSLDGSVLRCSARPLKSVALNTEEIVEVATPTSKARSQVKQPVKSEGDDHYAVVGKAKAPLAPGPKKKLPPPPPLKAPATKRAVPYRSPSLVSPDRLSKKSKSSKASSSPSSSPKKESSWETIIRDATAAEKDGDYQKAKDLFAKALAIIFDRKKNAKTEAEKNKYLNLMTTYLARAENLNKMSKKRQTSSIVSRSRSRRTRRSRSSRRRRSRSRNRRR